VVVERVGQEVVVVERGGQVTGPVLVRTVIIPVVSHPQTVLREVYLRNIQHMPLKVVLVVVEGMVSVPPEEVVVEPPEGEEVIHQVRPDLVVRHISCPTVQVVSPFRTVRSRVITVLLPAL
jgi:hypothetical protein